MITVVTKPFESSGKQLASGTVVDSTTWRLESRLINTRFLREATESEVAEFTKRSSAAPRKAQPAAKKPAVKAKATTVKKAKTPKRKPAAAAPATASTDTESPHSI